MSERVCSVLSPSILSHLMCVLVSLKVADLDYLSGKGIKTGSLDASSTAAMRMAVLERACVTRFVGFLGLRVLVHDRSNGHA